VPIVVIVFRSHNFFSLFTAQPHHQHGIWPIEESSQEERQEVNIFSHHLIKAVGGKVWFRFVDFFEMDVWLSCGLLVFNFIMVWSYG
jgi:hypothetical protein